MKKVISLIILLCTVFFSFAQQERINCIVFIDGKLPGSGQLSGYVEYFDTLQQKQQIKFYCEIGEIKFSKMNLKILQSLPDTTQITLFFKFREFYIRRGTKASKDHLYSMKFYRSMLLNNNFIIFLIENEKKGTYRIAFSSGMGTDVNFYKIGGDKIMNIIR